MRLDSTARFRLVPLALVLVAAWAFGGKYIQPADVDYVKILPGPPANDSPEHMAEMQKMIDYQNARTPEEIERCKAEAVGGPFEFSEVLGTWFNAKDLPLIQQLMIEAAVDTREITSLAKDRWQRPRPYVADTRIKPCVVLEDTFAYPSGHATRGIVWATILSEMFPERRDELMKMGKRIGDDRVMAGVHHPTDVEGGQKLGAAIAAKLLASEDFKAALAKAKAEALAVAHTH